MVHTVQHTQSPSSWLRGTSRAMGIIETHIDHTSPDFQENALYSQQLIEDLRRHVQQVQQGGGADAIAKHRKRNKILTRDLIQLLCDPHTPSPALTPLPALDTYTLKPPPP